MLNDSAPVTISETDKAMAKYISKVAHSYKEEAWPKCSIYRLPVNGHDENVGRRNYQKMRKIGHDYQ